MDHPEKLARMEENLEFLRAVSRGGPVSFSGKYFAIDDFDLGAGFLQQPLPIWMAGNPPAGTSAQGEKRPRTSGPLRRRVAHLRL